MTAYMQRKIIKMKIKLCSGVFYKSLKILAAYMQWENYKMKIKLCSGVFL